MNIFKSRLTQVSVLILTCCALGSSISSFAMDKCLIQDFDEARDAKDLTDLFNSEAHWLTTGDYTPEFMIKYKAPNTDLQYMGKLRIDVRRINDEFVGFLSSYMKSPEIGQLFIGAVKPKFRGKGYAESMLRYRLNEMKKMGAKAGQAYTLPDNMPSQGYIKRIGFYEIDRGDNWVLYNYDL